MKKRSWSWIGLGLLLLAGAWFFWPAAQPRGQSQKPAAPAVRAAVTTHHAAATAPLLFASGHAATNSLVKTNPFAYRLTNTKKSLVQLMRDPHAILLENALLDTRVALNLSIPKNLQAQGDPGAYIVQAGGPINNAFRATLVAAGAQIVSYIPNNAYLVRLSAAQANGLTGNAHVQAVLPYEPYYKISPVIPVGTKRETASVTPATISPPPRPTLLALAVQQKPLPPGTFLKLGLFGDGAAATISQIKKLGGKIVGEDRSPFGPIVFVQPSADWLALVQLPGVQIVEPAARRGVANDLARVTLGISADTVTPTNYMGLSGSNVLVEVNDTGIDANHPDFSVTGSAETPGTVPPSRIIGDINNPNPTLSLVDTNGHGTHVAGIIAGNGSESYTVTNTPQGSVTNADFRGKAPAADLYSVAALDNTGASDTSDYYLQTAPALTNALISNNSWTYSGDNSYDLAAASYDAAVRDALPTVTGSQPVLFVFAAGNDGGGGDDGAGGNPDTIMSPGTAKDVITVGALEQFRNITNLVTTVSGDVTNQNPVWQAGTDSGNQVAGYSARGNVGIGTEGAFGRFKPDVVAPGSFVVSTRSEQWDQAAYYNPTNYIENDYVEQLVGPNTLNYYSLSVPVNAVGVAIYIVPDFLSPSDFPTNLPIYVQQSGYPDPVNAPGSIDITTTSNSLSIPPDSGGTITGIQSIQNGGFYYAVGNTNNFSVYYDLITEITTTNEAGDYYTVLSNLNDSIGPWYRYESGTSMAAPAVSGTLALIQDYFTNTLRATPSPALLKAMLINGATSQGSYAYSVTNNINLQGWGLPNIQNSVPLGLTNQLGVQCSDLFLDQSPTNALATGDSQTFLVTLTTNTYAEYLPLKVTLAWTDPPGNPAAAIKLVNNLVVVVTNLDTGDVYYGNNFDDGSGGSALEPHSVPWITNTPPNLDTINNVENVFLSPLLGSSYSVTVLGYSVNVNAVTAQTNNVVQDYALVIACGEGEVSNAITVTASAPVSNPTGDQDITVVGINGNGMATNSEAIGGVFLNQLVGANTPLLGTNTVEDVSTNYSNTAVITAGMTNQWHFYVVQNTTASATNSAFTNAAFVTFSSDTLSMPRMGVLANAAQNPTTPDADIDMYVSTDPGLTNLDPNVISNCVNGTQVGVSVPGTPPIFNGASLSGGGTEYIADTASQPNEVYYVGVKSETAVASEYGFLPVFSQAPFSEIVNGNEIANGLLLPVNIPDGSPIHPSLAYVFALAIQPMQIQNVIVSDQFVHQNFGDLIGKMTHNNNGVILNNHDSVYNPSGIYNFTYDSSPSPVAGSQPPDGPGSLNQFQGQQGTGPWILTEVDDALTHTGAVTGLTLTIMPNKNLTAGVSVLIPGHGYYYGFIDVPVGATNLTIAATNYSGFVTPDGTDFTAYPLDTTYPGQLFEKLGQPPAPPPTPPTNYDKMVILDNPPTPKPGGVITVGRSDNPPIEPGRYFVTLYNASPNPQGYWIIATLGIGQVQPVNYTPVGSVPLLDDAVSYAYITNYPGVGATNETIASIAVGLRVEHPRISDLVFTLISPDGTRYLLMQNRGGTSTNGAGATIYSTNDIANVSSSGDNSPSTNYVAVSEFSGTLPISWNFYTLSDQMTVYDNTNGNYTYQSANMLFDTGMTNGTGQTNLPFSTTSGLTIIMNQFGNTNAGSDQWSFTAGGVQTNFYYLTFTDDTNITTPPIPSPMIPIKFAPTPFVPGGSYGFENLVVNGSFETPVVNNYIANMTTGLTGWTIASGNIDLLNNNAWQPAAGNQSIDLDGNTPGAIYQDIPTVAGQVYTLRFAHACNPDGQTNHTVSVFWAGVNVTNALFTNQNTTTTSMGWQYVTLPVIGSGGLDRLEFEDLNGETDDAGPTLDDVSLTPVITPDNLYYQPEQDLTPLVGTSAYGLWTLEIQDDRVGATNDAVLDSWQLQFVFADTNPAPFIPVVTPGTEICNPIPANDIQWYQVNVPLNAIFATNTLISSDQPVNLLINTNSPDTNGAVTVLTLSTSGTGILSTTNGVPLLVPGSTYYLGVQNPNAVPVADACIEVDFGLLSTAYAYTEPAQLVTGTSAQLNGFATPNGYAANAWFEWGTNTAYGNSTPPVPVGAGYSVVYVTNSISIVTNVPYHFRLVVSNALGVVYGFDQILDEANMAAWGPNYAGQLVVPTNQNVTAIAGAYDHSLALTTNGQILAWGDNTFGQTTVPAGLSNAVTMAVAGGEYYSMALLSDGTVTSWGANLLTQTNVPAGLSNVVLIAGGTYSSLALQNNGTVVAWGATFFNLTNVPVSAINTVSIAGGAYHSLALKNDGTVTAWGDDSAGQTDVPAGLNNVVAIAAGGYHSLALKADGTVVAWGDNSAGQTNVPAGLSNVVAIAAGGFHSLALKADGTVVTWGDNSAGQQNVPGGLTNFVAIAAGYLHSLALTPQSVLNLTNVIIDLVPGEPQTGSILPGGITYYRVSVPTNADFATNILLYANNGPLNIWFTTNTPPTLTTLLGGGVTNGVWILSTNGTPPLVPGSTYYLGLQNTNNVTVDYGIEVDFHLTTPVIPPAFTNVITISSIVYTNGGFLLTWFAPSNDLFQVQWSDGFPPSWQTFTNIVSYNTNYPASATNAEFTFFDDGSQTPPGLPPIRFYRLIQLGSLTSLSNGVPQTVDVAPGSTAYFTITVPPTADAATNALLAATAPVNLLFNQNNLPTGANTGGYTLLANTNTGISILTGTTTPPLVPGATYYLGVQNTNSFTVQFTLQVDFQLPAAAITNYPVSGVIFTNIGGTNGILFTWFAPTNYQFQIQWTTSLSPLPVYWTTVPGVVPTLVSVTGTTGTYQWFDDFTLTGGFGLQKFYRLIAYPPGVTVPPLLIISSAQVFPGGGVQLQWAGSTNYLYDVLWTTNLALPAASWNILSNLTPPVLTYSGGTFTFSNNAVTLTGGAPGAFFQVLELP